MEVVSVELPCKAKKVETYNAMGKSISRKTAPVRVLSDVRLTGPEVYTALVECDARP